MLQIQFFQKVLQFQARNDLVEFNIVRTINQVFVFQVRFIRRHRTDISLSYLFKVRHKKLLIIALGLQEFVINIIAK